MEAGQDASCSHYGTGCNVRLPSRGLGPLRGTNREIVGNEYYDWARRDFQEDERMRSAGQDTLGRGILPGMTRVEWVLELSFNSYLHGSIAPRRLDDNFTRDAKIYICATSTIKFGIQPQAINRVLDPPPTKAWY